MKTNIWTIFSDSITNIHKILLNVKTNIKTIQHIINFQKPFPYLDFRLAASKYIMIPVIISN